MVDIITYEKLYEVLREEKYKQELQPVDKNFYSNVVSYVQEKQKVTEAQKAKDSVFSDQIKKTQKQIENIKKMIKEVYERRENKILQLALFSSRSGIKEDTSNMLEEEKKFFASVLEEISRYRKDILERMLAAESPQIDHKAKDIKTEEIVPQLTKTVLFTQAVPQFMGTDLQVYGPFEPEAVSALPERIAQILIQSKRAEEATSENEKEDKKVLPAL